tara:strand:+ start:585 stop:776 length:192 start_codon:yes stop_codon:yes gene_type:complete
MSDNKRKEPPKIYFWVEKLKGSGTGGPWIRRNKDGTTTLHDTKREALANIRGKLVVLPPNKSS